MKFKLFICLLLLYSHSMSQTNIRFRDCQNCNTTSNNSNSPSSYNYGSIQGFLNSNVTSDYGPRSLGGYNFHGGIDFSTGAGSSRGDAILAIGNGTIKSLDNRGGIISITIEASSFSYAFRHLFDGSLSNISGEVQSGKFILKKVNNQNSNRHTIIDTESMTAYGILSSDIVTYNGQTLNIQNTVVVNSEIGPIGDSNGSFATHLHIQGVQDSDIASSNGLYSDVNSFNPLKYITSSSYPNYTSTLIENNGNNFIHLNYNGSNYFKLRVRMDGESLNSSGGYSNIFNLDDISIEGATTNSYSMLKNSNNDDIRINYGGDDSVSTLSEPNWVGVDATGGGLFGSNDITGVEPRAYFSGSYDNFFLFGFHPRVSASSSLASINKEALFFDGDFTLRSVVIDIYGNEHINNLGDTILDNFLPYIKKVTLSDSEGIFYEAEWTLNSSETELILNRCTYRDEITDGFEIEVETSESLNNLSISILDVNSFPLTFLNSEKTLWGASLAVNIPNNNEHTITFEGIDTAGNLLLSDPSNLYYRVSDTSWDSYTPNSPTNPSIGSDIIHKINLPVNGSCNCNLQAGRFVASTINRNQLSGLTVTGSTVICEGELTGLTVSGGSGSYNWYLEGDFISDENPLNYTLPVGENNITVVDTADPCDTNASFTVTVDGLTANAGANVTIQANGSTTLQGSGGSSCSWSPITGLSNPNSCTTSASPSQTTTYTLTVTENGCTDTDQVTITVDGTTGGNPPANDDCSDAITLTSGTSCNYTTGTVEDATPSFGANLCDGCSCTSPDDYDVYYKFTAVATSHTVTVGNYASNFDAVIELRTACSSGSSNYISCYDPTGSPSSVSETWTGLTVGQTYYIRVFEWGYQQSPPNADTFDICVTHQSSNTDGIDLISDITSVSDDNPDAGNQITVDYSITNNGDETMTDNTTSALYLSTNQTFGSSDILITGSVYELTTNLSPNQSINLSSTVTLPNVSDGQYYIISYPDLPNLITESNNDNNTDAYAIQIGNVATNGPNLDVRRAIAIPDDGLVPGQEVEVEIRIENDGNEDSNGFDVIVYLDIDDDGNPDSNELMGEFTFSALDADEDETVFEDFNLPVNIPSEGTYDLIVIADSNNNINETNENDNDKTERVTIALVNNDAENDLVVLNQTVSSTNVNAGQNIDVTVDHVYLGNNTTDDLPSISLGYYLSTDCNLSIDDILLDDETSNIGINKPVQDEDETLTIPVGTLTGTYYVLFVADNEYDIDEGNFEDNNVECIEITVTNNTTPVGDITVIDGSCLPENIVSNSETYLLTNIGYSGGQIDANSYRVHYYFSIDCILSDDDIYLDDGNASLSSDITISTETSAIILPTNLQVGTYYILILADAENELYETNEDNNISCIEFNIVSTDTNYQDVTLSNPYVSVTEANIGDAIPISVYQNYTGYQTEDEIDGITVHYYLSTDCELSSDDHYFNDDNSFIGNDDSSDKETYTMVIPDGISAGQYYVLFVADATDAVVENNEDNNTFCVPIFINETLSVEDNELISKIKVYPNPVSDVLTINLGEIHTKINLEIFNVLGQKINVFNFKNKQEFSINTSSYANGIYFFKIKIDAENTIEFKIIKQ